MPLIIKIDRPKNIRAVLSKVKNDAKIYNVNFEGNHKNGVASGSGFKANYIVDKDDITVCVLEKPIFVSKSRIEKEVRKYLA